MQISHVRTVLRVFALATTTFFSPFCLLLRRETEDIYSHEGRFEVAAREN